MEGLYHLISARQLTSPIVERLLEWTGRFEKYLREGTRNLDELKGAMVYFISDEESTRTKASFLRATWLLGGFPVPFDMRTSSLGKKESLEDMIQYLSGVKTPWARLAEIIIIRHSEKGVPERAAAVSGVPIINAGDGSHEHPTQAYLNLYNDLKLLGRKDHFTKALVGDLAYSRVARSELILYSQCCKGVKFFLVAPRGLELKEDIKSYIKGKIEFEEVNDIKEVVSQCDIAEILRIQKNHIKEKKLIKVYQKSKDNFALTREVYQMSEKRGTFFCHPMPIDKEEQEIRKEVWDLPRVVVLDQAANGVPARMAILSEVQRGQKVLPLK